MSDLKTLELSFPFKGIHETSAISEQPEGTTPSAVNVRGYDPIQKRDRGAQRAGLAKAVATRKTTDKVELIVAQSLGNNPGGINYSRDMTFLSDGNVSVGATTNYFFSATLFEHFRVSGGQGVDPTDSGNSVFFCPGLSTLGGSQTITFQSKFKPISGITWQTWISMSDMVDVSVKHYVSLTFHSTEVNVDIKGPGGNGGTNYAYGSTIADGATYTFTCVMTPTGFTFSIDGVLFFTHNYTGTELTRLGGYTASVSPMLAMDGGGAFPPGGTVAWQYDDVSIVGTSGGADIVKDTVIFSQSSNLYLGNPSDGFNLVDATALTPATAYHAGVEHSITAADGYFWIVDGLNALRRVHATSGVIDQPAATSGTLPAASRLTWLYRGRLWHGRFLNDPRNYIASKSGDPLNYNTGDRTQTGAFAANNTQQAGLLGDILTAAIPYGDVTCVMGMANSIAIMRGDPKAGGSVSIISHEIGIVRPTAWARDPQGNLFFMSRDGLYVMGAGGSEPKPMSRGRMDSTLGSINHNSVKVIMTYDPGELGLKIYLVPTDSTQATTVVFWDQRKNAFWKDTLPAGLGPTAVAPIVGAGLDGKRYDLLGCWDGYLRLLDPASNSDDGTAISSLVRFAPISPVGQMLQAKVVQARMLWGKGVADANFSVTYKMYTGTDPVTASAAAATYSKTITAGGYQSIDRTRSRGNTFIFELSNTTNNKSWELEQATLLYSPSGRVRA
jgi:hypothetical protein